MIGTKRTLSRRRFLRGGTCAGVLAGCGVQASLSEAAAAPTISLSLPRRAKLHDPIPVMLQVEAAALGPAVELIELNACRDLFPGIARVSLPNRPSAIEFDWQVRLDRTETLMVLVHTSDGVVHRVDREVIID